jgi:endoglycosylceramidase
MSLRGALAVAIAVAAASAAPAAAAAPELDHSGRWIVDAEGRVVVLHGFNMVAKLPPYHAAGLGFGADDARFLRRHGFNTVRLGLVFTGLAPRPGHYDEHYLDEIAREVRLLSRHGIHVLLDLHQDMYNRQFQGSGFPDWMADDDGLPREPKLGFPFNYYFMPALHRAYDNLWQNSPGPGGIGLQDHLAAAWQHVARRMRRLPGLLGYDLMNEPAPGSRIRACSTWTGCPGFDRGPLTRFNRRVSRAIRAVDRRHLIWHEPLAGFGFGAPTFTDGGAGKRAGFSFHIYCIGVPGLVGGERRPCSKVNLDLFRNAERVSRRTGDALLLTEFGADVRWPDSVVEATSLADRFMVGWQEWAYTTDTHVPGAVPPGELDRIGVLVDDAREPPRGGNVAWERLRLLARPFPRAVAGTPVSWSFDPGPRRFELVYDTRGVRGRFGSGAQTEIVAPRLQYPSGYRVRVNGARVVSRPNARVVVVAARPGARRVEVSVTPSGPG